MFAVLGVIMTLVQGTLRFIKSFANALFNQVVIFAVQWSAVKSQSRKGRFACWLSALSWLASPRNPGCSTLGLYRLLMRQPLSCPASLQLCRIMAVFLRKEKIQNLAKKCVFLNCFLHKKLEMLHIKFWSSKRSSNGNTSISRRSRTSYRALFRFSPLLAFGIKVRVRTWRTYAFITAESTEDFGESTRQTCQIELINIAVFNSL